MDKRIVIGLILVLILFVVVGLYCCLVVASKYDDQMQEYEDGRNDIQEDDPWNW